MKKMMDDKVICGVVGTAVSATGAGLSVNEIQAIVSIIVTIAGFLISVALPWVIKLIKWWRNAKKDGKIDDKELDELGNLANEGKEGLTQLQKDLESSKKEEVSEKSEGE